MPTLCRVHHVQLAMPRGGEPLARAFYSDLLELEEVMKPVPLRSRGGMWFRSDGVELHLGVEEDFRPAGKAHPGLQVCGLKQLAAALVVAGVEVTWDRELPGHRRFYAADPFGNRLEFLEAVEEAD